MTNATTAIATFGAGCFWCTEAVFQRVDGVLSVVSGYAGGQSENPNYHAVCSGMTGHAECVRIEFDPSRVTFAELVLIFFKTHDPTSLNRQGADIGTQYRSVIFCEDAQQQAIAEETIRELDEARVFPSRIVTQVVPAATLYSAESYHQNYFNQNTEQSYCQYVIAPKLAKFEKEFRAKLKR